MAERRIESLQHNGDSYTFNDPTKLDKSEYSGFPDVYNCINMAWGAARAGYTAPCDGWLYAERACLTTSATTMTLNAIKGNGHFGADSSQNAYVVSLSSYSGGDIHVMGPLSKGDIGYLNWMGGNSNGKFIVFIPARKVN